jgi:hypothetical protein
VGGGGVGAGVRRRGLERGGGSVLGGALLILGRGGMGVLGYMMEWCGGNASALRPADEAGVYGSGDRRRKNLKASALEY